MNPLRALERLEAAEAAYEAVDRSASAAVNAVAEATERLAGAEATLDRERRRAEAQKPRLHAERLRVEAAVRSAAAAEMAALLAGDEPAAVAAAEARRVDIDRGLLALGARLVWTEREVETARARLAEARAEHRASAVALEAAGQEVDRVEAAMTDRFESEIRRYYRLDDPDPARVRMLLRGYLRGERAAREAAERRREEETDAAAERRAREERRAAEEVARAARAMELARAKAQRRKYRFLREVAVDGARPGVDRMNAARAVVQGDRPLTALLLAVPLAADPRRA